MKRKKIFAVALSAALIAGVAFIGSNVGTASAYLTDFNQLVNTFKPGENNTDIDEDFPTPTPIEKSDVVTISKEVRITNEVSEGNGVACYVRAKIFYSTSDLGKYTVQGMSDKWVLGTDDYYYYTKVLQPGETTEPLMKSLKIDGGSYNPNFTTELEQFDINIYEESYQAKDPDTQELMTWQEAWERALQREVTTK